MRYQEPIYIQNQNNGVRNKDILNVNMSSDISLFQPPTVLLNGATKIDCTGVTSGATYIVSSSTETLNLEFTFTGNTSSLIETTPSFKFEIYKYNNLFSGFSTTPVYKSEIIQYSVFSGTNSTTATVAFSGLSMDGDYLIKPYYQFKAPTSFINKLGKTIDTKKYITGNSFGIYDENYDYHFVAIREAETPILTQNPSNEVGVNILRQSVIIPTDNQTIFPLEVSFQGEFLFTLNGLVLANGLDYTYSGNVVTLNSETYSDDIVSIIYTSSGGNNLASDVVTIDLPIVSGATNNQADNSVYYNTDTNKYELYCSMTPRESDSVLVMINGATLANGIDFYQSISNPKRIILEGILMLDDVITIIYYPRTSTSLGLNTNTPVVSWSIQTAPTEFNGNFIVEIANDNEFNNIYYTGLTNYAIGINYYYHTFTAVGNVGTKLYYRVKNEKKYVNICGEIIYSSAYSETIPLIINTNSINSY
jgi:hypothetical protein